MDSRYIHPAIAGLWSAEQTYALWLLVESHVISHQIELGVVPRAEGAPLALRLALHPEPIDVAAIAKLEQTTKHDVAAFLAWVRAWAGPSGRWLHFGLTSSDVVDTAQGMRFRVAQVHLRSAVEGLASLLDEPARETVRILARTHGQVAVTMPFGQRVKHWQRLLEGPARDTLQHAKQVAVCKLSGPVGDYVFNPPELEVSVARSLGLRPHGPGASQIAVRSPLAAWASSAASLVSACNKIALDLRLMNLLGETQVGMAPGQVGSSSMAHKQNPIREEQLAGLSRMAHGYAAMLQPLETWLERDISQSCVERVAVPDLWHVTLHAVSTLASVVRGLHLDQQAIAGHVLAAGAAPDIARLTLEGIRQGLPADEARQAALAHMEAK